MCVKGEVICSERSSSSTVYSGKLTYAFQTGLSGIPQQSEYFPKLFISFAYEVVSNHDIAIQKTPFCGLTWYSLNQKGEEFYKMPISNPLQLYYDNNNSY